MLMQRKYQRGFLEVYMVEYMYQHILHNIYKTGVYAIHLLSAFAVVSHKYSNQVPTSTQNHTLYCMYL